MFDSIRNGINADLTMGKIKSVHESFKGNTAYEDILADFDTLDWEKADFDQVEKVAKRVTKKAAAEGLKVGAKFLGEAMVEWGGAIGLASGNPVTGGLVSAIGAALEWGTDMLYERLWPEVKIYRPGDIVLVNKTHVAIPDKEGLRRRRMPADVMTTGIVVSEKIEGKQRIFDLQTGVNTWYPTGDLKAYPPEKVNQIRKDSPRLANIQDSIKLMAEEGGRDEPVPHHSVRKGDRVLYKEEMKEIEETGGGHLLLSGFDGSTALVNIGNSELRDTWQSSSAEVPAGKLVWIPSNEGELYELAVVTAVMPNKKVRTVSAVTGLMGDYKLWQCIEAEDRQTRDYPKFVVDVMRGDKDAWMDSRPYLRDGRGMELILKYPRGHRLEPLPEREIYIDDFDMDGFVPQPYLDDLGDKGTSKSGSGMTLVLVGAAGILAFLLSS